jgi:hypothetical protein
MKQATKHTLLAITASALILSSTWICDTLANFISGVL